MKKSDNEKIHDLVQQGYTYREIARMFGFRSHVSIFKRFHKYRKSLLNKDNSYPQEKKKTA